MISGSLDGYVNFITSFESLIKLPIVGPIIKQMFPMTGSVEMLGSTTGPVGSLSEGFEMIGS